MAAKGRTPRAACRDTRREGPRRRAAPIAPEWKKRNRSGPNSARTSAPALRVSGLASPLFSGGRISGGASPSPPCRHSRGQPRKAPGAGRLPWRRGRGTRKNTETKEMEKFTRLEALLFTAVLENCIDQLLILGYIMPVSYEGKTDINCIESQEMQEIRDKKKELDTDHQELTSARQGGGETVTSKPLKSTEHKQQLRNSEDLKRAHHLSNKAMKHSALPADTLRKIQADRQYASDVITATMKEMQESGTFNSLIEANGRENAKKSKFHDILIREEEGKKEIKSLQKQLQDVKKETEMEFQNRDNMIVCLKDEFQEMKAKTDMEKRYIKKSTDLQVHQTQKKCSNAENGLNKEIEDLKRKTDEEIRVHMETENFLRQYYKKVEEKLEYWVDKYENDTDAKDKELEALKESKANNLEMLQRFASECQTFEETIIADRTEKEAKRRQLERDALELKSILKLQAWWRGTMVHRNLGPYQNLRKSREKQLLKQTNKKDKPGAKKKKR
uniref:IQ motif containing G n=1 Tax=Anser cygnoides TaxID=8845 RepID=A0A8B9ECV6_ANSCY|nr:dynein regulatory complex protein 9 isoform X1 [Anser cygnoides]XP_047932801.1 dynein regulatory complex protein 9 isoform X1 [Anser cygnoides]XP_047932802.1 dynein regulatory complex protein 9 isoform X1 [Anser cygnoides]